ncbi:MAG: hypothetical protein IKG58_02060 [Bacilli bacterium]|nr:hypothetical protein [Bacilli bacterium]
MSKKVVGGICGIIALVSVAVMVVWGTLSSYNNTWLAVFIGGILCGIVTIIGNMTRPDDKKKK